MNPPQGDASAGHTPDPDTTRPRAAAGDSERIDAESAGDRTARYWGRHDLTRTVLDALTAAGKDLDHLSVDDLAATDQFHGGGRPATLRLAQLADLAGRADMADLAGRADMAELAGPAEMTGESGPNEPGEAGPEPGGGRRVLDVGGGLGGPARVLAERFGCLVTVIDLTPSYVATAQVLTDLVGLADRVTHQVGDALDLPFADESFDLVWTQNSGMNIAYKERLYQGFYRVLRAGGTLAFQEPMAGAVSPPHFPLMWAAKADLSFLWAPSEVRALLASIGFEEQTWELVSEAASSAAAPNPPPHAVQRIIMGDEHLAAIAKATRRNLDEDRITTVHGVFTKR